MVASQRGLTSLFIKRFVETANIRRQFSSGRQSKITPYIKRFVIEHMEKDDVHEFP